eukprot:c4190_g1_i1.p1 GENE.c4190_g1_i1~~c4190_g1_i1.p1  ORF type:complete len:473 (+),score=127.50 c4190_g1_i1:57-1475(+)
MSAGRGVFYVMLFLVCSGHMSGVSAVNSFASVQLKLQSHSNNKQAFANLITAIVQPSGILNDKSRNHIHRIASAMVDGLPSLFQVSVSEMVLEAVNRAVQTPTVQSSLQQLSQRIVEIAKKVPAEHTALLNRIFETDKQSQLGTANLLAANICSLGSIDNGDNCGEVKCHPGSVASDCVHDEDFNFTGVCTPCAAGMYDPGSKIMVCNYCEACTGNTYSGVGQVTCTNCPDNATANNEHTACTCNDGYQATDSGGCEPVSPSATPSISVSESSSSSTSLTPSISESPTASVSPSFSASISFSPSISESPSGSSSTSLSLSSTASTSLSASMSMTPSTSFSPTMSTSVSGSASLSPSISITPSITVSPTISLSPSPSWSPAMSESGSPSPSNSISFSSSITPSASPVVVVDPPQTPTDPATNDDKKSSSDDSWKLPVIIVCSILGAGLIGFLVFFLCNKYKCLDGIRNMNVRK